MPFFPVDLSTPPIPAIHLPPTPEVVDVPADLPVLEPDVVIAFPLNETVTDMVVVPGENNGQDVIYAAVSQERVNVWAAAVYFTPEIVLAVSVVVVLAALRKLWVTRRFTHRRGELYCRKCWAGLNGVTSDTCPECGRLVRKTRRTAKRSKRSPLHARWCWALAALLCIAGTATLWFGEAWLSLYRDGFAPKEAGDWWALVDPVDRESPIRINKAAGWFAWYSADLAKHARENDAAWMRAVAEEYYTHRAIQYRLLIRRYDTIDGAVLSSDRLPPEVTGQDQPDLLSPEVWLHQLAGVVIVDENIHPYRYRYDQTQPWIPLGERDNKVRREIVAVTPDERFIVLGQVIRQRGPQFRITEVDLCIAVHDAETGEQVGRLQTLFNASVDADLQHPTFDELAGDEVEFPALAFVPLDDGKLLLVGEETMAVWALGENLIDTESAGRLAPSQLRDDLWSRLQSSPGPIRYHRLRPLGMEPFQRQLMAEFHEGYSWSVGESLTETDWSPVGRFQEYPLLAGYEDRTDVPLYKLDPYHQLTLPFRVLRIEHQGWNDEAWVSESGRWVCLSYSQPRTRNWQPIIVDTTTNQVKHELVFESQFRMHGLAFVNRDRQIMVDGMMKVNPNLSRRVASRDVIYIYSLEDDN